MRKTYFNDAIIGNGKSLGCLTSQGELVRLYWPDIDKHQFIDAFYTGITYTDYKNSTHWMHEDGWVRNQYYKDKTNILVTEFLNTQVGLKIIQTDFASVTHDKLIRNYKISNNGADKLKIGFMAYFKIPASIEQPSGQIFDSENGTMINHREGFYIGLKSNIMPSSFQIGNNALACAKEGILRPMDETGMMADSSMFWDFKAVQPGEAIELELNIYFSKEYKSLKSLLKFPIICGKEEKQAEDYWINLINSLNIPKFKNKSIAQLYIRTVLTFKLLCDSNSGGILAAPEFDEEFSKCGKYGYCWCRDAAFVTEAMDLCGLHDEVKNFYRWSARVQDDNGSWHQRYCIDGSLAPGWGQQIDETGSVLWGILKHFEHTNDYEFLKEMWPTVEKAANYLIRFIEPENGLPFYSFDLWEERLGQHAYSCAAVYGGLLAASEVSKILFKDNRHAADFENKAYEIRESFYNNFVTEEGVLRRSIRVKLNPWGKEPTDKTVQILLDKKFGNKVEVSNEDNTVDASLLGVSIPFGLLDCKNPVMIKTAERIQKTLWVEKVNGILRYENDNYIGGNPWVLTSLWLAFYKLETGDDETALAIFEHMVEGRTQLGFLPEQLDRQTGKPAWVIPLTWSHAMFILVLYRLLGKGML